jgi:hypothetical protein
MECVQRKALEWQGTRKKPFKEVLRDHMHLASSIEHSWEPG